jgi:superfamily II DNA or RNA helicase
MDISPDGKSALPDELREILAPLLRYNHLQLLRGVDAYDLNGTRRPIRTEMRLLYDFDKYGRMVCGIGFLSKVTNALKSFGCDVRVEDCNPPHPRSNRYMEDWDNLVRNFDFRAKQEECLLAVASAQRGIIDAPTGFGKSFLFRAIGLLYPRAKIVITTKRKDIVDGMQATLSKYLPNIGQVGGGVNRLGRITVVTANSLHKINPNEVDILIADEVHELASPTYSATLAKFRYCKMFGFTATPTGRMDNADMKLESLFGPIIFRMTYQDAVKSGLVVPIHVRWLDVAIDNPATGMVDVARSRHGIWRNQMRNEIIANAARTFGPEEQVLIMVTTFDHAVHLRQFLPEFTLCYAERTDDDAFNRFVKNEMLPADEPVMTALRRQNLRKEFEQGKLKKVIATDVWSTGVNFNSLAVMIRADARSSEIMDSQIPGRVCRLDDGKNFGLLIDCLDQFDNGYREAAKKRRRNYDSRGWEQELPQYGRRLLPD